MTILLVFALLLTTAGVACLMLRRRGSAGPCGYAGATVEEKYQDQLDALTQRVASSPTRKPAFLKRCRKRLKIIIILYIKERFGLTIRRADDIENIRTPKGNGRKRSGALRRVYEQVDAVSAEPIPAEEIQELCRRAAKALDEDSEECPLSREKTAAAG